MAYIFETPIVKPCAKADKGGEIPLTRGDHFLSYQEVPASWFSGTTAIRWNGRKLKLPHDPHGTLLSLRGTDIPPWPRATFSGDTAAWPTKNCAGSLVFLDKDNKTIMTFGGPQERVQDGKFRFSVQTHTQLPSLCFDYKKKEIDGDLTCYHVVLHGNKSMKTASYYNPASVKAGKLHFLIPEKHQKAAIESRLLALEIEYGQSKASERFQNSVTVLVRPSEDRTQHNRWQSKEGMIKQIGNLSARGMSGFDQAMHKLFHGQNIKVVFLREIEVQEIGCMVRAEPEYNYWTHVMRLSIEHGPFWFYRMQEGYVEVPGSHPIGMFRADKPPPVPFWLVSKFVACVTGQGLTKLIPIEWAPIIQDSTLPLPTN